MRAIVFFILSLPCLALSPVFYTAPCTIAGGNCSAAGGSILIPQSSSIDTTAYNGGFATFTISSNVANACTGFTVSNVGGSMWVAHTNRASSGGPDANTCLWTSTNFTGSAGDAFTASNISGGAVFASGIVGLFDTTRSTSSPYDQSNGAGSSGAVTSLATGSITPGECNELIVSGYAANGTSTGALAVDSSMTIGASIANGAGGIAMLNTAVAWKLQTSIAAIDPTWSDSGNSTTYAVSVASIKAANSTCPGGGGSTTPSHGGIF